MFVDAGARALRENGKSLLPWESPGAKEISAAVRWFAFATRRNRVCRGIAEYAADEIRDHTLKRVEVVHRDNLVIL
jgi:hypothetical protein